MLKTLATQVAALNNASNRRTRDSVTGWLQRTYPEKFGLMSERELTAAADEHIDQALRFGFSTAEDIATYLDCAFRFAEDFPDAPQHAEYAHILYDAGSTAAEKLRSLELAVFPESDIDI